MPLLKLFLFWLLAVAVPLQGFAASSQLFCATAGGTHSHAQAAPQAAGAHGHAHAQQAHSHAAGDEAPATVLAATAAPDCSLCAACCNAVGAGPAADARGALAPADTTAPEPVLVIPSRPHRLPEKPPRA